MAACFGRELVWCQVAQGAARWDAIVVLGATLHALDGELLVGVQRTGGGTRAAEQEILNRGDGCATGMAESLVISGLHVSQMR